MSNFIPNAAPNNQPAIFPPAQNHFISQAAGILDRIERELSSSINAPKSGQDKSMQEKNTQEPRISYSNLRIVQKHLEDMVRVVAEGRLKNRNVRYKILARIILDQWPSRTAIGEEILELEENYLKL